MIIETVEIKVEPCKGNPEGRLVINAEDLTDDHVLFEESKERLEILVAAIGNMDEEDESLWTSGKPKTSALADIIEGSVSADERDEAWELYSGGK